MQFLKPAECFAGWFVCSDAVYVLIAQLCVCAANEHAAVPGASVDDRRMHSRQGGRRPWLKDERLPALGDVDVAGQVPLQLLLKLLVSYVLLPDERKR